jgi:hypothetical protein
MLFIKLHYITIINKKPVNFKNLVNSETPIKVCLGNKHFVPQIEKTSNGGYIKMEHNIMPLVIKTLAKKKCKCKPVN